MKVADRSKASSAMLETAAKGRALMGGTEAMRSAGKTYLPKFDRESVEAYAARLDSSWLFNGYRKTVRDMTGRIFDAPVELAEDADADLVDWCTNADMQGNDLSTVARRVFEDALSGAGVSYILVEAPARNGMETRAQVRAANIRPYLVHLRVEDVIGWKARVIGNAMKLAQLRVSETLVEDDPKDEFAEVEVEQVRVYDLTETGVTVRLFRKGEKEQWVQFGDETTTGLTEITLVPFYANRTGFMTGAPLLDDLADVNVAHWQSQSDQRNILRAARVPILFATGRSEEEGDIVIGANTAVTAMDTAASLAWVEHSGQAIGAGRQDLKDLEFQMEAHGLQLLVARGGAQSATGEALDAAKETSTLAMTADALQDALEQAMIWMGEYGGVNGEVSVVVNKEFGVEFLSAQEVTAMLGAVNAGQISRETFINEMNERGFLKTKPDPADEAERIADEGGGIGGLNDDGQ